MGQKQATFQIVESAASKMLFMFGNNDCGQILDQTGKYFNKTKAFEKIFCGPYNTFVKTNSNDILCWGENIYSQCGQTPSELIDIPVQIHFGKQLDNSQRDIIIQQQQMNAETKNVHQVQMQINVHKISAGSSHACAIAEQGILFSWGCGEENQLGYRLTSKNKMDNGIEIKSLIQIEPKIVEFFMDSNIIDVACGKNFTIAINSKHEAYSFGWQKFGVLGLGNYSMVEKPTLIPTQNISGFSKVAAGLSHVVALNTEKNRMYTWGNPYIDLKTEHQDILTPQEVKFKNQDHANQPRLQIKDIQCGIYHSIALSANGEVYTWGANCFGQLGFQSNIQYIQQEAIPLDSVKQKVEKICTKSHFNLLLLNDGSIVGFGSNLQGCISKDIPKTHNVAPMQIYGQQVKAKRVSCGYCHAAFLSFCEVSEIENLETQKFIEFQDYQQQQAKTQMKDIKTSSLDQGQELKMVTKNAESQGDIELVKESSEQLKTQQQEIRFKQEHVKESQPQSQTSHIFSLKQNYLNRKIQKHNKFSCSLFFEYLSCSTIRQEKDESQNV